MTSTDTSEKGLEALIEKSLIETSHYVKGQPHDYDRIYCIDKTKLLQFLRHTQPQEIAKLETKYQTKFEQKLLQRISDQIKIKGIIEILRNGIKADEVKLTLYYKKPDSQLNPQTIQQYNANIFSVTRQLQYSDDKKRLSLDMAIFINGLPVITFELKNNLTKQNVQDAIKQYQKDRDPKETLFSFARCLVHFAVDDELIFMTTELKGEKTIFLPFNKGQKSEQNLLFPDSAGNPINPNGIKTDYLWKEILTKSSLSNIIEKYVHIVKEKEDGKKDKKKLIFPRYHQLDAVRQLLSDVKNNGIGKRYLIQHSAGSGKTNSISWLSHQLVE
ncbi:MAG: type I restriction endonuclease, partial [Planktothrix sp.]|uniref:type I restriction endonuclease n=1 Tax=Planktothrix sp. TaxID=3088171 RepID=UPI0038D42D07